MCEQENCVEPILQAGRSISTENNTLKFIAFISSLAFIDMDPTEKQ